ncbi:MAG: hypothetical protein CK424_07145 [Legionella sp.]|nr:MAG: hypothetical protein CK424_07145 [Legionella sp.]
MRSAASNYFFKLEPSRFAPQKADSELEHTLQQEDYIQQVEANITEATVFLENSVKEGKNPIEIFNDLLSRLGKMRHELALKHKTEKAELFGVRRDLSTAPWSTSLRTKLCGPYQNYNTRLSSDIQKHLETMQEQKSKELRIEGKALNKKTSMTIKYWNYKDLDQPPQYNSFKAYKQLCQLCEIAHKPLDQEEFNREFVMFEGQNIPPEKREAMRVRHSEMYDNATTDVNEVIHEINQLLVNKEAMRNLKKNSIEDYNGLKMRSSMTSFHLDKVATKYSMEKFNWVHVTVRTEIKKRMYAFSQYLTLQHISKDLSDFNIELIHQDPFLIEETLDDIAGLFKTVLEWDKSCDSETDLVNTIALINYEFSHAAPFIRGSAAIGEWLEHTLYRYHGFTIQYKDTCNVNMEALTLPLEEFVTQYPSMVERTSIHWETSYLSGP